MCTLKKIGIGWNKFPSTLEWRSEAKRGQIQALCAKEKSAHCFFGNSKKKLNQFSEKCPKKSVGCELECPCGKFDIAWMVPTPPDRENKGVLRSEPGRTADIVPINIFPNKFFSQRPQMFCFSYPVCTFLSDLVWNQARGLLSSDLVVKQDKRSENVQTSQNSCRKSLREAKRRHCLHFTSTFNIFPTSPSSSPEPISASFQREPNS